MTSIFSKIVKGEIPAYKVAENEKFLAFLDINPLAEGHTLVIPKQQTDYIFDIDDITIGEFFIFAKKVAIAIEKTIPCKRIGVTVIGLEVPHAHIHLIPLHSLYDMDFKRKKLHFSPEAFEKIASAIRTNFYAK
ncbi:MAG: HIT family protein [Lentimicrobiaceae bacterium]|nr:HIT family protein [Lentimicrobiaceae bacterium]